MIRVLIEALVIGLKIYWAANKAGKREVVSEINKNLDQMRSLPQEDEVLRMQHAARITLLMRQL